MKKSGSILLGCLAVISIIFASCSSTKATETPILQNTETAVIKTEPTATSTPTPAPTATPEPIMCNIAFDTDRDGNWEIYKTNPDGSETVNLSNNPGDDHAPVYSPNGDQIAFVSNRDNGQEKGKFIYVMNADGSNVHQLTHEENCEDPDWSHDGKMITYSNNGDIYVINADGSGTSTNITKDSPVEDMQPSWSPDGTKIAWLIKNQWGSNAYVMDADGSNVIQVGFNNRSFGVQWIPDGRLFTGWIWESKDEICQNCISNIDGTGVINAGGKGEIVNYLPFWTASGTRAELVGADLITGNNDIFVIGGDLPDTLDMGIGSINISNNPANDRNPDAPINCGGGWVIDTEAIEANAQPAEASAQPIDMPTITIGYAGDDPAQWQRKNDFDKACGELGIQCVYGEIPELLNQKVSAIVLNSSPERIKDADSAISEATKKGIPVFVLDAEIELDGVYTIMADQGDMMRATLDELFKESGGAGELAYFDFSPTQRDAETLKGILEKEYPKIKVVTTDTKKFNFKTDKMYMNELLGAYPNLKAIWTNDGYDNAIFGIVEQYSDPAKYPKLKCGDYKDGFYIWKDRLVEHPEFECVSVSNPPGIAYDAVYAAHYLVSGETIDESALGGEFGNVFLVDFPIITNDNVAEELEKIQYEKSDHVVDRLMTADEIKDKWFK
jgi:hypothetical protein